MFPAELHSAIRKRKKSQVAKN